MSTLSSKKWWGQAQRHAVQHHDKRQVRQWNKAGCFTLLERITRLKIVSSEVISKIHSPTWKGIPRRVHANVTNPAWITHLLRTIFANSDVIAYARWNVWQVARTVHNEKNETKLFGNGMVVLGLATSHCRKLTWKMKFEAGTSKGRLPLISLWLLAVFVGTGTRVTPVPPATNQVL